MATPCLAKNMKFDHSWPECFVVALRDMNEATWRLCCKQSVTQMRHPNLVSHLSIPTPSVVHWTELAERTSNNNIVYHNVYNIITFWISPKPWLFLETGLAVRFWQWLLHFKVHQTPSPSDVKMFAPFVVVCSSLNIKLLITQIDEYILTIVADWFNSWKPINEFLEF